VKGINSRAAIIDRTAERIKPEWINRPKSAPKHAKYIGNPIGYVTEVLGDTLTIEQKLILSKIAEGGEINVQAAHGVGKSFIASRIVHYNTIVMESETITTAPTFRQVKNVLWKELRKLHGKVKNRILAECGQVFLRSGEGSAFGFTAQHNSTDAFQGVHAAGLTVIIDEACGISHEIDNGATACAVDAAGAILRIGNPTDPNTAFGKSCRLNGSIRIPVWNHPNVAWAYIDGQLHDWVKSAIGLNGGQCWKRHQWQGKLVNLKDPVPGAVSIEWIEKIRHKFTEDSAYWQSRVNAYFPDNANDGIIPHSWLIEARARYDRDPNYWDNLASGYYWQLGLDVADGGGDRHSLATWRSSSVLYGVEEIIPKGDREDTMRIAGIAAARIRSFKAAQIAVDNLGVGAGTLGSLIRDGFIASACTFSASPTATPEDGIGYANLKAQLYWELRESLKAGEIAIAPLGDDIEAALFEELAAIRYDVRTNGQIICEEKKKVKQQLGRSPDLADAVVIGRSMHQIRLGEIELLDLDRRATGDEIRATQQLF
jgi:hypothetical protein